MHGIYNKKLKDWLREGPKQIIAVFRTRAEADRYLRDTITCVQCDYEVIPMCYPFLEKTHFREMED